MKSRRRLAAFSYLDQEEHLRSWAGSMGRYPSGQRGQTVNLLALPSKVRILPGPPFDYRRVFMTVVECPERAKRVEGLILVVDNRSWSLTILFNASLGPKIKKSQN